jgi:hypothetical protein
LGVGAPPEASWSQLGKKYPKRTSTVKIIRPFLEVILHQFYSGIAFGLKCVESIVKQILKLVLGRPPTRISKDFEVISTSMWKPFY